MIAFAVAQLADALTMGRSLPGRTFVELNPVVLRLGDDAYAAKALLILAVFGIAYALSRTRYRVMRGVLLTIGTVAGMVGAISNVGGF